MNPCSRGATPPLGAVVYVIAPRLGSKKRGQTSAAIVIFALEKTFKITFVQPGPLHHADGGNFVRILQTAASLAFASGPGLLSASLAAGLHRYFLRQFWSTATRQRAILPRIPPRKQLGLHFFGTPPPMFRGECREEESIHHCEHMEQAAEDPVGGMGVGGWHQ